MAASSIRYSAFFGGSVMPAQHTRPTGLLCGRPVALELSTRQLERSGSRQGQLQTSAEDAFIYTAVKRLAYKRCFTTIRSTNWQNYLLTKSLTDQVLIHRHIALDWPLAPTGGTFRHIYWSNWCWLEAFRSEVRTRSCCWWDQRACS